MANDLSIEQLGTTLNSIVTQATGKQPTIAVTNTASFVNVAQTALLVGTDPLLNAIGQVLSRTIFSIRPYNRKFKGMYVSNQRWGNHIRKLNIGDKDWEKENKEYTLEDGKSIDMYPVNKPLILQTNFYGQQTFSRFITIFKNQLDTAFRSPDEFASFLTMITTNANDNIEQAHESMARAVLSNFIGGKISGDPTNVKHVLTDYYTQTGIQLTAQTIYAPENFKPFILWLSAYIAEIREDLTERTILYHINVDKKAIPRHTPKSKQKMYILTHFLKQMETMALSEVFHNSGIGVGDRESVNFWQSVTDKESINVTPVYMSNKGTPTTGTEVNQKVLGIIFDEEAMGININNTWSSTTPLNSAGGYANTYFHFTESYWNDFTENAIVLTLD